MFVCLASFFTWVLSFCPYQLPQVCRVEDILVEGLIEGSVVHFHRARTITVKSYGNISTSGMGLIFSSFNLEFDSI